MRLDYNVRKDLDVCYDETYPKSTPSRDNGPIIGIDNVVRCWQVDKRYQFSFGERFNYLEDNIRLL